MADKRGIKVNSALLSFDQVRRACACAERTLRSTPCQGDEGEEDAGAFVVKKKERADRSIVSGFKKKGKQRPVDEPDARPYDSFLAASSGAACGVSAPRPCITAARRHVHNRCTQPAQEQRDPHSKRRGGRGSARHASAAF
jgi:hypothetical protein